MSNCYSTYAAQRSVPCSAAVAKQLVKLLSSSFPADSEYGPGDHGFTLEQGEDGVVLVADEQGNPDALGETFLAAFGKEIAAAGLPFLLVSGAFTSDRVSADSAGGTMFRIMPDGRMVWPEIHWPE